MDIRTSDSLQTKTSLLGFGCMRFPTTNNEINYEESKEMIDYAMAHGINYYDTAYPYHEGTSETFLARALIKDYPRDSFYLADKMPVWDCKEESDFERLFQEQLSRLNTDYIDFYLVHCLNKENWEKVSALHITDFLVKKKAEGKIRHIGFSFHDTPEVLETILNAFPWEFVQIQLNYFDWEFQRANEQYQMLTERNIPVIVMEPVRGGNLANFKGEQAKILSDVSPGQSFASWAIRWIASLDNVITILSGMSSLEQVTDNIRTFSPFVPLSEEENFAIRRLTEYMNHLPLIPCTGCKYCVKDCPKEINIPDIFHKYNEYMRFQNKMQLKNYYIDEYPKEKQADQCIKCKHCESMCPQHIKITEELEKIHALAKTL